MSAGFFLHNLGHMIPSFEMLSMLSQGKKKSQLVYVKVGVQVHNDGEGGVERLLCTGLLF